MEYTRPWSRVSAKRGTVLAAGERNEPAGHDRKIFPSLRSWRQILSPLRGSNRLGFANPRLADSPGALFCRAALRKDVTRQMRNEKPQMENGKSRSVVIGRRGRDFHMSFFIFHFSFEWTALLGPVATARGSDTEFRRAVTHATTNATMGLSTRSLCRQGSHDQKRHQRDDDGVNVLRPRHADAEAAPDTRHTIRSSNSPARHRTLKP